MTNNPDLNSILSDITRTLGISLREMKKHCREQEYVAARAIFYHLATEQGYIQQVIADRIGHCRVTVFHGLKLIEGNTLYKIALIKFNDLKEINEK